MDSLTEWEINDIIEYLPYLDRNLWETCRLNTYVLAQSNSTKKLTMQDIAKFKWEESVETESNIEISNEDIKRLKEKSKLISNVMQNKNKL